MADKKVTMDPRTGVQFGYHGAAQDALEYALEKLVDDTERMDFLAGWLFGGTDYPEFYVWLKQKRHVA